MSPDGARPGHPCVGSGCDHPESEHIPTPELATSSEVVVWCASCRRHEVHHPRRFRFPWRRSAAPEPHRRISRPS